MLAPRPAWTRTNPGGLWANTQGRQRSNDLLQRRIGNQAVLRQLGPQSVQHSQAATRPRLTIGAIDGPLEREADRVADQVMRMPSPTHTITSSPIQLSGKCATCENEEASQVQMRSAGTPVAEGSDALSTVDEVVRGPAQPLGAAERAWLEPRFGQDFGGVRIHSDSRAGASARAVNAHAYTVGRDIVFGDGQYRPNTDSGRALLAHEVVHVVQQSGAGYGSAPVSVQRDADPAATGAGGAPAGTGAGGAPASPPASSSRPLTAAERDVAAFIFGSALNLDPITIKESSTIAVGGYIRTLPDTIYISPGYKIGTAILMHELTHCAQYQHGVSRLTTGVTAVVGTYDYGGEAGLLEAIKTKKCFDHFNTEQQGDIVQDYYEKVVAGGSTYPWSVFIDQVRAHGACIWPAAGVPAPQPAPTPKGSAQA